MHVYMIWTLLLLMIPIYGSNFVEKIHFDPYGNFAKSYYLDYGAVKKFSLILKENHYIHVTADSIANISIVLNNSITFKQYDMHLENQSIIQIKQDYYKKKYAILHFKNTYDINLCNIDASKHLKSQDKSNQLYTYESQPCNFILFVSQTINPSHRRRVSIKFNSGKILRSGIPVHGSLPMHKRQRYGFFLDTPELSRFDRYRLDQDLETHNPHVKSIKLPLLVQLTPNRARKFYNMDLDLYCYFEFASNNFFFPNKKDRNHLHNYPETLHIRNKESKYYINAISRFNTSLSSCGYPINTLLTPIDSNNNTNDNLSITVTNEVCGTFIFCESYASPDSKFKKKMNIQLF